MRRMGLAAMLLATALCVALAAAGCGETPGDKPTVTEALDRHKQELFAIPGVNSVGSVESPVERIEVYVPQRDPAIEAALPDTIEGYPVVLVVRPEPKYEGPDIAGVIKKVTPVDTSGSEQGAICTILVVNESGTTSKVDKASVAIMADTSIWEPQGEGKKSLTADSLREGASVIVTFRGPVAESYPVQATADDVEVLP